MSASCKIRYIVRLRQMLLRWRRKAALSARNRLPPDVPAGHIGLRVGSRDRRYVIPAIYLNHPMFRKVLVEAEEEYGFTNSGPLSIPCEEVMFEEMLRQVGKSVRFSNLEGFQRQCNVAVVDFWPESWPLLDNSVNYKSY